MVLCYLFTLFHNTIRKCRVDLTYSASSSVERCKSVVERLIMLHWVVGSTLHDGTIELFLVSASALLFVHIKEP